jgi:uncharacterized membrane protein YphA (DoxX/SURF4 family)
MSSRIEAQWILLLARVVLATVMIHYGWPKVRDLKSNGNDFVNMGFKPGMLWGTLIALVEFLGGVATLLGFYAELAAGLFAFEMMVGAFWKLKIKKPFADYSYDIQLFALSLVLMSQGAGALALKPFPGRVFLRWDLAAAALAAALLLATLSKPQFKRSEQAGTPGSSGHQRQATSQPHGGGQPVTP